MLSEAVKTRIEHLIDTRSVKFGAWLYRRTGGRITRLWRRPALLLTTTGRRTGLLRTVLVQFFPDREDFIVVAANSVLPVHPAWYLNLTAHPEALVEVEGRMLRVRAEQLSPDEADEFWPRVLAAAPDYARYRQRTDRAIPLLRLVPQQDVAMPNHDEMNITVAPPTDGQGITSPPDRSGNHPGRSFHISAVFWGSLVGLVFLAVTVWATDPRYAETSPITDLGFFALGMVIATGFLSQLRTDPPITGLHQGVVAAAALAAAGLLGSRIEPLVGGLVISAAFAVLAALHPAGRTLFKLAGQDGQRVNLALMALAVIAAVPAAGQAGVLLKSARAAGPSCFLGQCARGDRLAELAAALLTVAVVALLAALRPSGVRLPLWTAAASAVLIGAASLALPGETPSLGMAGGAFAVGWGVLFIATGEGEQYLWHRGTPQAPLREPRDHANIVRRANSVEERAAGSSLFSERPANLRKRGREDV